MDKFHFIFLCVLLQANLNVSAGYVPTIVQDSLKSLYPDVKTVASEAIRSSPDVIVCN